MKKVRVGISFDREVVDAVDGQVAASPDLSADRSEIVNALTKFFFEKVDGDHDINSRTMELLIRERRRAGAERGAGTTPDERSSYGPNVLQTVARGPVCATLQAMGAR